MVGHLSLCRLKVRFLLGCGLLSRTLRRGEISKPQESAATLAAERASMSAVDWNEKGTLYFRFQPPKGEPKLRSIWSAPLQGLVIMAMQGHEGPLENMLIKLDSGPEYLGEAIGALAHRPDRPRFKP